MNRKINVALIYGSTREWRFCDTAATLLARLNWWATALHDARQAMPYESVV